MITFLLLSVCLSDGFQDFEPVQETGIRDREFFKMIRERLDTATDNTVERISRKADGVILTISKRIFWSLILLGAGIAFFVSVMFWLYTRFNSKLIQAINDVKKLIQ